MERLKDVAAHNLYTRESKYGWQIDMMMIYLFILPWPILDF